VTGGSSLAVRAGIPTLALILALSACSRPAEPPETRLPLLPESAFRVEWTGVDPVTEVVAGSRAVFAVSFRNRGSATWPDPAAAKPENPDGMSAVRLAWRWRDARDHRVIADFGDRSDLPWPIGPGAGAILPCEVDIPAVPGEYELEFQLVEEGIAWFDSKGAAPLVLPVSVAPR
jgi:hypothetical protein